MATPPLLSPSKPFASHRPVQTILSLPSPSPSKLPTPAICRVQTLKPIIRGIFQIQTTIAGLVGAGLALTLVEPASAAELSLLGSSLQFNEPANALSLPTWAIHVSSVVEWIIAMALVWQYGEESGFESWKGLSWGMGCLDVPLSGIPFICWLFIAFSYFEIFVLVLLLLLCLSLPMVPLLGGAFCACTWHFFYNSESLEVLVALQAALTVIGNATMCFAAFRIYKSSQEGSKNL